MELKTYFHLSLLRRLKRWNYHIRRVYGFWAQGLFKSQKAFKQFTLVSLYNS